MKEFGVQATQEKLIVQYIGDTISEKTDKRAPLILNAKGRFKLKDQWSVDDIRSCYNDSPNQAIVMSVGSKLEDTNIDVGDIVFIGMGGLEYIVWKGEEYLVVRAFNITGIIKK